jgi:DNA-binding CsgD family transcriptional regulator
MLSADADRAYRTSLRARRMRPGDAARAAAMMIVDLPMSPALAEALPVLLHKLIAGERLAGYCVEGIRADDSGARGRGEIVAFGLSGFLSDARAEAFLETPIPNFSIRILERCLGGEAQSGLLGVEAVARANAGQGLNLAPICWLQRPRDRTSPKGAELMALNMEIFLKQHRGYNLKRIVKEVSADEEARFVAGGFARVKTMPNPQGGERVALVLTREQAQAGEFGSALGLLFASRRPRLGFTRNQQKVLEGAVDDLSDEELADHLNLSTHTVNMRWRTIYHRIDARPKLAADIFYPQDRSQSRAAGGRKRRRVVAFARAHPEELRPFSGATK